MHLSLDTTLLARVNANLPLSSMQRAFDQDVYYVELREVKSSDLFGGVKARWVGFDKVTRVLLISISLKKLLRRSRTYQCTPP